MTHKFSILLLFMLLLVAAVGMAQTGQTLQATYGPPTAANTWEKFTIPLTAATFGTDEATFAAVLANVTLFRIGTECHDGDDVGAVDQIRVGASHNSDFESGSEGWNAGGDGTMEWVASGGSAGGFIQISDWASGDWHWAVAPLSWAGDWSSLIGQNIEFYFRTDYPDYAALIEISSVAQKRLVLAATNLSVPAGNSTTMSVTLSEPTSEDIPVNLTSSSSCFVTPAFVTIANGQSFAEFEVTAPESAADDCESVITASATGYGDSRVTLRVEPATASLATLTGRVTDATTGVPIANATVSVAGLNATSDADGYYTLENIPTDNISANFSADPRTGQAPLTVSFTDLSGSTFQILTVSATDYIVYEAPVSLHPGQTSTVNVSLSPIITDNELRLVLNWAATPLDLDIHLLVPPDVEGGSPYHIYYSNKGRVDQHPYALLDIDKQRGFGPETITIKQFVDGRYVCYIHNYTNDALITQSQGVVQIYGRSGLLGTVNVPLTGDGRYWDICTIDGATSQVTITNTIASEQPRLGGEHGLQKLAAKQSIAAAEEIVSWQWDFNDDGTIDATLQNPTFTYTTAGQYTVSLTVSDGLTEYTERKENYITVTPGETTLTGYDVSVSGFDIANFPLVKCFVSVTDVVLRTPVAGLTVANFQATEENLAVGSLTVSPLSIAADAKADIVFVFDVTGSMSDEIQALKDKAIAFADSLSARGIDYRLGLVTFSDLVEEIYDFTADVNEFKSWIAGLVATGGGDTNENALEGLATATRLSFRDNTQRIGILITDADFHEAGDAGDGTTSHTTASMITLLKNSGITLNVIGPNMTQHETLATETGGQYYLIFGDFRDIIDRINKQITTQYVVTFVSPNPVSDETWRDVLITVQNADKGGYGEGGYYIGGARLIMNPPTILGRAGQTFTLDIRAESVVNLGMLHTKIAFDQTKLEALTITEGDFLNQGGASSAFVTEIQNSLGLVDISASRLAEGLEPGVSGSGLLGKLTFRVLVDECTSTISFQSPDARHPDNTSIEGTTNSVAIRSIGQAGASELLCDFDDDLDIDTRDFALLGTYWKPENSTTGDVGPANGAAPVLTPLPDTQVNYEDLFVFTRMWNWYHAAVLTSGAGLAKTAGDLSWQRIDTADNNNYRLVVNIECIDDLAMGHLVATFNAQDFAFTTANEGLLLMPDESPVAFLVEEKTPGRLEVSFARLTAVGKPAGLSGSGSLLMLDFTRQNPAATMQLNFDTIDLRTPTNQLIFVKTAINNGETTIALPETFAVSNYPNPFNSRTTIEFQLPVAGQVRLEIINILGQPVRTITERHFDAGSHKLVWDGKNEAGNEVVSGAYFVRLQAGSLNILRKVLYLK